MSVRLVLIAAVARNGVIGASGSLPWRLPEDLRRFRSLTTGHTVVMGRKTWESLPRALPDRQNIVITRQRDYEAAGAIVARSLDDALALASLPQPVFCIGGGEIFREALLRSDEIELTLIDRDFDGDACFPAIDPALWQEIAHTSHRQEVEGGFAYDFITYDRKRSPG